MVVLDIRDKGLREVDEAMIVGLEQVTLQSELFGGVQSVLG